MYTLNQTVKVFNDIADAHKQINFFDYGLLENIASSGTITYPYLYLAPRPAIKRGKSVILNFTVVLSDLSHKTQVSSQEIESDLLQVCNDIVSLLQDPDYPFKLITENIRMEPFRDRFEDEVTGWLMDLSIEIPVDLDRCAVPGQALINSNPACPDVRIYNSAGTLVATIVAGGIYTIAACPECDTDTFLNFVFGVGATADYTETIVSGEEGTYTTNTLTNVSSVVYKKNGGVVTLPFTVAVADTLQVIPVITNTALEARVKLTGTY